MTTPPPSPPPSHGRTPPRRLWLTGNDDLRAADSFDALTDLFLGEVARPGRDQPHSADDHHAPVARPAFPSGQPILRLIPADGDDLLDLPIPPAPDAPPVDRSPSEPAPRGPGFIECLAVGNLPVLASAWAAQYVREVAEAARRPVAFLRVQAGYVTLELVGEIPESALNDTLPAGDFSTALRIAAETAARWVVRVDQADEPLIAARPGIRLVTLITGTDEAARVHAYGILKDLSDKLPADGDPQSQAPQVRIALMSAAEHVAEDVGRKLVETAEQFLARKVQYAPCSARIRASRPARMVFTGRLDQPAAAIVEQAERALGVAAAAPRPVVIAAPPPQPPVPPAPDPVVAAQPIARAVAPEPPPAPPTLPTPETLPPVVAASTPVPAPAPTSAPAPVDDVALWSSAAAAEVKPAPKPAASAPADTAELAGFIAGLTPLAIRCPYAPAVQLGLASDGRLHLLARSPDAADDERSIAGLMVAASWVQAHAALLGPAIPGYAPAAGPAGLHLFTASPKASRRLLDTDLRLHLLAPVTVAGQTAWFCTELN